MITTAEYQAMLRGGILNLSCTNTADIGPLAGVVGLEWLDLSETQVSNLEPLAGLTGLKGLNVIHAPVSDFRPLAGMDQMEVLYVSGTTPLRCLSAVWHLRPQLKINPGRLHGQDLPLCWPVQP